MRKLYELIWMPVYDDPSRGVKQAEDGIYRITTGPRGGIFSWWITIPILHGQIAGHALAVTEKDARQQASDAVADLRGVR